MNSAICGVTRKTRSNCLSLNDDSVVAAAEEDDNDDDASAEDAGDDDASAEGTGAAAASAAADDGEEEGDDAVRGADYDGKVDVDDGGVDDAVPSIGLSLDAKVGVKVEVEDGAPSAVPAREEVGTCCSRPPRKVCQTS